MVALLLLLAELLLDAAVGVGAVGWFVAATVDECPSTGIVIVVVVIVASVPANEPSATAVAVRNARSKIDGTGSSIVVVSRQRWIRAFWQLISYYDYTARTRRTTMTYDVLNPNSVNTPQRAFAVKMP